MKKIVLLLAVITLGWLNASAQNDTVCAGATGISYWVNGKTGSTFNWTIGGGTQSTGGNSDSITVDFASSTGIDTIIVIETDTNGCLGDPVKLAVVRMPNPDATISAGVNMCFQDSTDITVTLTGTGPWDLTYSDSLSNTTVNVTSSPYIFNTGSLPNSKTFTLVQVEDRLGCLTPLSGVSATALITVYPKVVTPAIQHN